MGYPTTAELVEGSSDADLTALDASQQDALRAASIIAVERFCRQSFAGVETATVTVPLSGGVAYLPRRVESLTSVEVASTPYGLSDVELDGETLRFLSGPGTNYYERTLRSLDPDWPVRGRDVTITADFGWPAAPDAVALALRWDMEEQAAVDASGISPTVLAFRKMGLTSISQGGLNAQIGAAPPALSARSMEALGDLVWLGGPSGYRA